MFLKMYHIIQNLDKSNKINWVNKNNISKSGVVNLSLLKNIANSTSYPNPQVSYTKGFFQIHQAAWIGELSQILNNILIEFNSQSAIEFDISEVGGMSCSRSNLSTCSTMSHFVHKYCLDYFSVTHEDLKRNLNHHEIRIINRNSSSDFIHIYGWKDMLYLSNSGGSHHFASAQYIARHLGQPVPIKSNFRFTLLNEIAIRQLNNAYHAFLISSHDYAYIIHHLEELGFDALSFFLPNQSTDGVLIIFPKTPENDLIADSLNHPFTNFIDELFGFLFVQKQNPSLWKYLSKEDYDSYEFGKAS